MGSRRCRLAQSRASRFVEAGGLRWHVQVMGSGPVALLLHGTGAATHSWRDFAPLLSRQFKVVAPDLPGHGFTGTPDADGMSLPGMARGVDALLQALGETPVLCVGHSAGAAILAQMSLTGAAFAALVSLNGAFVRSAAAGSSRRSPSSLPARRWCRGCSRGGQVSAAPSKACSAAPVR